MIDQKKYVEYPYAENSKMKQIISYLLKQQNIVHNLIQQLFSFSIGI